MLTADAMAETEDRPDTAAMRHSRLRRAVVPTVAVVLGASLLGQALAGAAARTGEPWATSAYWVSLAVMVGSVAYAQTRSDITGRERLALVMLLGAALYGVKIVAYPTAFSFYDELSHARTALDILQSQGVASPNPVLPISPDYPGLELFTALFGRLTGVSVHIGGLVVVGLARLMLVGGLYALFRLATANARLAGLATIFYMANPSFIYFDSSFAYESLALSVAVVGLALILAWSQEPDRSLRRRLAIPVILLVGCLQATHHLTSYAFAMCVVAYCICVVVARRYGGREIAPWTFGGISVLAAIAWLVGVAPATGRYLTVVVKPAVNGVVNVLTLSQPARTAFSGANETNVYPLWLRICAFASVVIVVVGVLLSLRLAWRYRHRAACWLLAGIAVLYFPTQALRFTSAGTESANRASEFVFVGVGYMLGLVACAALVLLERSDSSPSLRATATWRRKTKGARDRIVRIGIAGAVAVMFCGGVTILWPSYALLPGPFIAGADVRSVSPSALNVAEWMRRYIGPRKRVLSDRSTDEVLAGDGNEDPVLGRIGSSSVARVFVSPTVDGVDRTILHKARVQYVIVDLRFAQALPARGWYFAIDEPGAFHYKSPIPLAYLTKFGTTRGVSTIYSDGNVVVYDVREIDGS